MSSFFAGVLAGVSADSLLHPIDNLKCMYQTRENVDLKSFRSISALYRGFPTVLAGSAGNGLFYMVYDKTKTFYRPLIIGDERMSSSPSSDAPKTKGGATESEEDLIYLAASSTATMAASFWYCPLEVTKETAFVREITTKEAIQHVLKENGPSGFFRGFFLSNATWLPYLGLYFVLYERLIRTFLTNGKNSSTSSSTSSGESGNNSSTSGNSSLFLGDLAAGLAAGVTSATLTFPIDTWKTRVQSGMTHTSVPMFSRASGRALLLRNLWLAPGSSLTIAFYQQYMRLLGGEEQ